jgi:hypothetical protein
MRDMAAFGLRLAPDQKAAPLAHPGLADSLPKGACHSGRSRWRFLGD